MTKFWVGEEGIPRGLKPYFLAVLDARAKARAYLRSNSKGNRGSFDSVTRKARVTSLRMTRFWLGGEKARAIAAAKADPYGMTSKETRTNRDKSIGRESVR